MTGSPLAARRAEPAQQLVTIVVPAKNEAEALGATLDSLPTSTLRVMGFRVEVVVLDGRSTDATAAIAHQWGAVVVTDRATGKGAALRDARDAGALRGDYVVMLDGDGTYAADAIVRAVARLAWMRVDVVMGDRRPQRGAMPVMNRIGNTALSTGACVLYGRKVPDLCTGFWAFRVDALERLPLQSRGFGLEAELFGLCSRLHLRMAHISVDYLQRHGRPKLSLAKDGWRIARRLVRTRFSRLDAKGTSRPMRNPRPESAPFQDDQTRAASRLPAVTGDEASA